jgi:peptidoglycan/xylan/chitin deacetylase (PgdA/CDA1 family)
MAVLDIDTGPGARVKETCVSPGTIALSFDDGPDPVWTVRVLAELARQRARATFFVQADLAVAQPQLIGSMTAAGHEVGFHCLRHVRHSDLSEEEVEAELAEGLALLGSIGIQPSAWRPPWGVATEATRRLAAEHRLDIWGWSFDSHDWRGDDCEEMLAALTAGGGLVGGTVALMHDGIGPGARRHGCAETVRLTAALLGLARTAGLSALPLSERQGVAR